MEVEAERQQTVQLEELVAALDQATLMAKQLSATSHPSQLLQIHTALRSAHHRLSLFLSHNHPPPPKPPPYHPHPSSSLLPTLPPPPENSMSSAVGDGGDDDEIGGGEATPMQMGDDEEGQNSRATNCAAVSVEKMEERMRECFIQNKRTKRPLSPTAVAVAEQWRSSENEAVKGGSMAVEFDRLRTLDLIYQFHA